MNLLIPIPGLRMPTLLTGVKLIDISCCLRSAGPNSLLEDKDGKPLVRE